MEDRARRKQGSKCRRFASEPLNQREKCGMIFLVMYMATNKGYLREDFRLFHLRDRRAQQVESHYHEFDKVVLLLSGGVRYTVEGVCHDLMPGELLLIRHHDIHRPVIDPESDYERIILWIDPEFLAELGDGLEGCFDVCSERRQWLYDPGEGRIKRLRYILAELERALTSADFGARLLSEALFVQLMVELNRCVLSGGERRGEASDPRIEQVIRYIHANLDSELSVDGLAAMCYLSRYYFMRQFKESTGYTVHSYIRQKRLSAAAELLESGESVLKSACDVGFSDYSAFLRAFRQVYGLTPTEFQQRGRSLTSEFTE